MINKAKQKARSRKMSQNRFKLRNELWPDLKTDTLWDRKIEAGYTTAPRTFAYIMQLMDEATKGKPVSSTYLALWCHVFDESLVKIDNPRLMAFESNFRGQRAETTWKGRMKVLKELGFIDFKSGPSGAHNYVLIFNPYIVIRELVDSGKILKNDTYRAFFDRAISVGAFANHEE